MGHNVISAIKHIVEFGNGDLKGYASRYLNKVNAVGEQLEFYIKDAIAGTFKEEYGKKDSSHRKIFSYLGNQNNPPDIVIKQGDAFEIKKIESPMADLALNSSPPKDRLYSKDSRITDACRVCEGKPWVEKELFYIVGHPKGGVLKYLFIVHGKCYAAKSEVYDKVNSPIKNLINGAIKDLGLEGASTNELGKVRRVDPLGITELRIRGMWQIENPLRVFSSECSYDGETRFTLFAIITKEKYNSISSTDTRDLEKTKGVSVKDIKIKDPNNPARQIEAKLITYKQP